MNILFIGSSGALSLLPFKQLQSSAYKVTAVGVYAPTVISDKIIALENESLALAANYYELPLIDLSQAVDLILEQCHELSFDVILMSCYSHRLPDEIISLSKYGCFNMHPSLLPKHRGPEPIFWQMKAGVDLGVSWHHVVHDFDAGNIVAQKSIITDEGASYLQIQSQLAEKGADLMHELLHDLQIGNVKPSPQNSSIASYQPYPCTEDFVIDINCSAQHAYNFMCATSVFSLPYQCDVGGYRYLLDVAIDYDNNATLEEVGVQADRLYIPCSEGVLITTFIDRIRL